jgi:hypothetical protein
MCLLKILTKAYWSSIIWCNPNNINHNLKNKNMWKKKKVKQSLHELIFQICKMIINTHKSIILEKISLKNEKMKKKRKAESFIKNVTLQNDHMYYVRI